MSAQPSRGSGGAATGGPLSGCVLLLHSSIPHLAKRGPVLQKRLESLGASVLIPGPAHSASSSKISSQAKGRGGALGAAAAAAGAQHGTAQARSRLSAGGGGSTSAASSLQGQGRSSTTTTSTRSTAALKAGTAGSTAGHQPVTHIVVGEAAAKDEALLQSLVQQAMGAAGSHGEVLSPPKVVTDTWVDSLATTARRVPSEPHTVPVTLPVAITTPPAIVKRPGGIHRLTTTSHSHSAGSMGSVGQARASTDSIHQQQQQIQHIPQDGGPGPALAVALPAIPAGLQAEGLLSNKPRWSIGPACKPAPDAPFARFSAWLGGWDRRLDVVDQLPELLLYARCNEQRSIQIGNEPLVQLLKELMKYEEAMATSNEDNINDRTFIQSSSSARRKLWYGKSDPVTFNHMGSTYAHAAVAVRACSFKLDPRKYSRQDIQNLVPFLGGKFISGVVWDLMTRGTCSHLEAFRANKPTRNSRGEIRPDTSGASVRRAFTRIPGVGPALARRFWRWGCTSYEQLEEQLRARYGHLLERGGDDEQAGRRDVPTSSLSSDSQDPVPSDAEVGIAGGSMGGDGLERPHKRQRTLGGSLMLQTSGGSRLLEEEELIPGGQEGLDKEGSGGVGDDETASGGGSGGVGPGGRGGGGGLLRAGENEAESQEQGLPGGWELDASQLGGLQPLQQDGNNPGEFIPAAAVASQGEPQQPRHHGGKRSRVEQPSAGSPAQEAPPQAAGAGAGSAGQPPTTTITTHSGGGTSSLGSLPPVRPLVVNDAPKPGSEGGEGEGDGMESDLRSRRSVVEVLRCLQHREDILAPAQPEDTEEMRQVITAMLDKVSGTPGWRMELVGGGRRSLGVHDADFLACPPSPSISPEGVVTRLYSALVAQGWLVAQEEGFCRVQAGSLVGYFDRMRQDAIANRDDYRRMDRYDHIFGVWRTSGRSSNGVRRYRRVDVIIVPHECWGWGQLAWTGSRWYLRSLRLHTSLNCGGYLNAHCYVRIAPDGRGILVPQDGPPQYRGKVGWPPGWEQGDRKVRDESDVLELLNVPYLPPEDRDCF